MIDLAQHFVTVFNITDTTSPDDEIVKMRLVERLIQFLKSQEACQIYEYNQNCACNFMTSLFKHGLYF